METQTSYQASQWHAELIFALGRYRDVIAFLHDEKAILAHVPHIFQFSKKNPNGKLIKKGAHVDYFRESKTESFKEIANFVSRQQIVFQVTLAEIFAKDLFTRAFKLKPERMLPYLSAEDKEPTIRVKRLLKAGTLDDLLDELIRQAALRASDCAPSKLIDRIISLGGVAPSTDLRDAYHTLVKLRNELVHDNFRREVSEETVEKGTATCEQLLRLCESAALALGISVDARYRDDE